MMIAFSGMCVANQLSRQISTTSFGMHNVPWKSRRSTPVFHKGHLHLPGAYEWREPELAIRTDRCGGRDHLGVAAAGLGKIR
jgi:hypothetical protein